MVCPFRCRSFCLRDSNSDDDNDDEEEESRVNIDKEER